MRPAARRSGVRVRILRRRGLPFLLSRLWKRTAFACGALLFVCLLYLLGSVIWFVEVQGAEQVPMASIRRAAAELGLRPGVWRHRVSGNEIGRDLVVKVPELAWAGVELRGSCAIVQVVEKKIVLPQDEPLGNIVAAKNGIISKIIAVQGKSLVKVGDTVQKGMF